MPQACNIIKKETQAQAFSCDFQEIFKDTYFYTTPLVAASEMDKFINDDLRLETKINRLLLTYFDHKNIASMLMISIFSIHIEHYKSACVHCSFKFKSK